MQLAKEGFNICLVSRTMSKLKSVEAKIKESYPTVKTRIVQADFGGNCNVKFYKSIKEKVKDIEIGMLVVNAGVMNFGELETQDATKLQAMMDTNMYQYCSMLKQFLPGLA